MVFTHEFMNKMFYMPDGFRIIAGIFVWNDKRSFLVLINVLSVS